MGLYLSYFILGFYTLALLYITIYCLMQLNLLWHYKKHHWQGESNAIDNPEIKEAALPVVTIQLPLYNELYVVERLIDNIVKMDYPKDKLEIQVLDDSTDESIDIAKNKVEEYQKQGFDIKHVRRADRVGYKAGALQEGMKTVKGEFIAIFDADFLPKVDFLKKTIPYFQDKNVGVVQTRWEHLNQDYSLLTELQAFQLNVHFTVEQLGRRAGDLMLQFNGTAGVWRKDTIESAGGWEADTLTEDLDLSYRAQLKGWEIIFLEDVVSPAELPVEIRSLKSQQYRWMKGGAETAKKMIPTIWKSDISLRRKIHATTHLLGSSIFVSVFIVGVFSVPLLFALSPTGINERIFGVFFISMISVICVYYVANVQAAWETESGWRKVLKFVLIFPIFLALSMGLSLHNTIAVVQGFWGKKSAFVRTPKFNIKNISDKIHGQNYLVSKIDMTTIFEGILAVYFSVGLIYGITHQEMTFSIFHLLLALGYGSIFVMSVKHLRFK